MNLLAFIQEFPSEESCKVHYREAREKQGIVCKKCGGKHHWWLKAKDMWQCSACNFRTSLKSGTIMENSNLPIRMWYIAMAFMSYSKKGLSAKELQRQLSHKYYEPIWFMMQKLRKSMGQRDALYDLKDMIQFDEAYVETEVPQKIKQELKRGKGSQRQQNVAVMAESTPLENPKTAKKGKHVRYFKMKVLDGHKSEQVDQTISQYISDKSIVFSDKSSSYVNISDYVQVHITEKSDKQTTSTTLKWVHIAIANLKRTLLGIYHKINGKYLQLYLDEFCFKLNRRYFGNHLFDRLLVAGINGHWYDKR